jgi:hypothetical protein
MRARGVEPAPKVNPEVSQKVDQILEKRLEERFGGKLVLKG